MKITAPTNNAFEIEELIKAGATELYFAYLSKKWVRKYSLVASNNRRYFKESSVSTVRHIKELVKRSTVPLYMAMNAPYYSKEQYKTVMKDINDAYKVGVRNFIIADIALIQMIHKKYPKAKLVLSTVATSLNNSSARFFGKMGVKRVILPRHLTFDEIKLIRKNVDLELETFALFDWCKNLDGLCTFHHGLEECLGVEHGCTYVGEYKSGNELIDNRMNVKFENFFAGEYIKKFNDIGINAVKIAGRRFPTSMKIKAIELVKGCFEGDPEELYFKAFQKRVPRMDNAY